MSESTALRLGQGDIELLQAVVMEAGQREMKARRKARKRKDKAAIEAHDHRAQHLARVHIKLGRMGGSSSMQMLEESLGRLISSMTGLPAKATVIAPGDEEYELLQKLRERHKGDAPAPQEEISGADRVAGAAGE